MENFAVRRSALRMWLLAIAGVPLVVIALDVLYRRRFIRFLSDLIFSPSDPQLLEPRDVIWAVVMLAIGVGFSGFGLKELVAPKAVVEGDASGLRVRLRGPFREPDLLAWDDVDDLVADSLEDEGERIPVMAIKVLRRDHLPDDPFGARWLDDHTLAVLASDWERSPEEVVARLEEVALAASRAVPPSEPV
jgi:hypothetical protein